jgi:hypothetical protein
MPFRPNKLALFIDGPNHVILEQMRRALCFLTERSAHHHDSPLSNEFPVAAVDNVIVNNRGHLIASLPTPAMAEDVAQRLNEGEWRREEERWAL